ncbi:Sporulation lipoprotein YhcN/YlaJ (Spore_YhcN_YlaJ) [Fontibacillus panacisegetis]|uniref:Sporulation lipoprotein YhcN/YlaJ (Spore_YhcN_YlaJ) n=1 Tax=Fontibacillus panacisegetis TaxID=670482 RepID=A0A1G7NI82_9BACL|nr:YhcN/YlaJ family sporulation lipoprotein [Fontibacillus panacisegetis]SDF73774.1 Sporulation lipoprotein YhcN/YlaJ (Spore_YhcN_YlaJ) [Fontibacillus panacisegetis]
MAFTKMNINRLGIIMLAVLIILSGTGCTANKSANSAKPKTKSVQNKKAINPVTKKISDEVLKVKGVSKATVLVHDKDVVVGIDVKKGEPATSVEENVRYRVEGSKPGYFVHVTSDKKIHERIKKLNTKMTGKNSVKTLGNDVGVIIQDIGKTIRAPFQ